MIHYFFRVYRITGLEVQAVFDDSLIFWSVPHRRFGGVWQFAPERSLFPPDQPAAELARRRSDSPHSNDVGLGGKAKTRSEWAQTAKLLQTY